jgi:type IV pilus assembly protein PilE
MNIRTVHRSLGFTLIELLVTILVVALLAKIAYESYINQAQAARRSSAKTALLDLASREARFYSTNNTYTGSMTTDLGYAACADGNFGAPNCTSEYYHLTIPANTATSYTASAAPAGPQATDSCGTYTIDYLGNKNAAQANCW